ncbi:hypothetical protein PG988_006150 [Apiospora saccharicola]
MYADSKSKYMLSMHVPVPQPGILDITLLGFHHQLLKLLPDALGGHVHFEVGIGHGLLVALEYRLGSRVVDGNEVRRFELGYRFGKLVLAVVVSNRAHLDWLVLREAHCSTVELRLAHDKGEMNHGLQDTTVLLTIAVVGIAVLAFRSRQAHFGLDLHLKPGGSEEITYRDVLSIDSTVQAKAGFPKFVGACALAKKRGYGLIWIDTCCIDITNSQELGEAINSMYRWYAESAVCFAYLQDITSTDHDMISSADGTSSSEEMTSSAHMEQSKWFQRGWTLQELIAPRNVCFYEANWVLLGDKSSLSEALTRKTGITEEVLRNEKSPRACSVAQRMSWAAARTTSRVKDQAYSLMGLFNVNMPMIYGEKEKAFIRLQQQIIASSTDESIFAWDLGALDDLVDAYSGLIAKSPACFAGCGNAISLGQSKGLYINQFGLSVTVQKEHYGPGIYRAYLQVGQSDPGWQFALFLAKLPDEDRFARVKNHAGVGFVWAHKSAQKELEQIIIPMDITAPPERIYNGLWIRQLDLPNSLVHQPNILARKLSPDGRWEFLGGEGKAAAGIIRYCFREEVDLKGIGWIGLGFDRTFRPICTELNNDPYQETEYQNLLATTQDTVEWSKHPFFELRRWDLCMDHSRARCIQARIDAALVVDENATGMRVPAKVWAFDITCDERGIFVYTGRYREEIRKVREVSEARWEPMNWC